MHTELTGDEVAHYRQEGMLVVPDFLDDHELALWREGVGEAVHERGWRRFAMPNSVIPDQETLTEEQREQMGYDTDKTLTQRLNLWQSSDKVRALMLDQRLGKIAADLAGVDGIRIWEDRAMIKKPYADVTTFHRDGPYWAFTSGDVVQMWVALEDVTLENGCLYLVPGSHKAKQLDPVAYQSGELGEIFEIYPEWGQVVPVPCPIPAGGACFFNGFTIHGAGANMTPTARIAMTCHYMPDGCTFNGSRGMMLPPTYLDTLSVGDALDDDRYVPLIFTRA